MGDPVDREHPVDLRVEPLPGPQDRAGELAHDVGVGLIHQQLRAAEHREERVAQIVHQRVHGRLEVIALSRPAYDGTAELEVLQGDGRTVGQHLDEPHLLGRRLVGLAPVGAERTDGSLAPDRHHRHALHERRTVGVVRHPLVDVDVGDDHGLPMQHRPAAHAGREREAQPLPERTDGVLVGVEALLVLAQHERRAVGVHQVAHGAGDDRRHALDRVGGRESLDHRGQQLSGRGRVLHAPNDRRDESPSASAFRRVSADPFGLRATTSTCVRNAERGRETTQVHGSRPRLEREPSVDQ